LLSSGLLIPKDLAEMITNGFTISTKETSKKVFFTLIRVFTPNESVLPVVPPPGERIFTVNFAPGLTIPWHLIISRYFSFSIL
jgi:hypothetical protein